MVYGINDMRTYVNKNRKYGTKLSRIDFDKIITLYNKEIIDAIIFDNYIYKIPRLCRIGLTKSKFKIEPGKKFRVIGLAVDRNESRKNGYRILHENDHTNGFVFKVRFRAMVAKNAKHLYKFRAERYHVNRYLAKILKNKDKYGVVEAPIKF